MTAEIHKWLGYVSISVSLCLGVYVYGVYNDGGRVFDVGTLMTTVQNDITYVKNTTLINQKNIISSLRSIETIVEENKHLVQGNRKLVEEQAAIRLSMMNESSRVAEIFRESVQHQNDDYAVYRKQLLDKAVKIEQRLSRIEAALNCQ